MYLSISHTQIKLRPPFLSRLFGLLKIFQFSVLKGIKYKLYDYFLVLFHSLVKSKKNQFQMVTDFTMEHSFMQLKKDIMP